MEDGLEILRADIVGNSLVIKFSDGRERLYPAELLVSLFGQVEDVTDFSLPEEEEQPEQ